MLAVTLALSTLTACGTTQPEKPAVISDTTAHCIIKIYVDSDLSGEYMLAYALGNTLYVPSAADARILKEANTKIWKECAE